MKPHPELQRRMLLLSQREFERNREASAHINYCWNNNPFKLKRFLLGDTYEDWTGERWKIDHFVIPITGFIGEGFKGRYVEPNTTYTRLLVQSSTVPKESIPDSPGYQGTKWTPMMTDTPAELYDLYYPFSVAKRIKARSVLICGLGLGIVVDMMLSLPHVENITVIENDREILFHCGSRFLSEKRVSLRLQDALTYKSKWRRFDIAWFDIWPSISESNIPDITRLHREWASRVKWYGSWGHPCLKKERAVRRRWKEVLKRWDKKSSSIPTPTT